MNGPNGEQFGEPGVFLEVVENERLVFTDAFRPGWRPSNKAFMTAQVLFEDALLRISGCGRGR
ncbi:SRPBCC domain-containing protein [Azospirillum sp. SYSU D00513]|uniref:SRPBCC domain-containing protein n=1 Tax=Azospirillum sp. SYSU D00513 TaxID=2812561 RepID=UPI001A958723|nr:SRPBCC domain-containing protein [Azospirillum sp. SYSU D00513]